jgi:serine protease Do
VILSCRRFLLPRPLILLAYLLVMFGLAVSPSPAAAAAAERAAVDSLVPHDRDDLLAIQTQVEEVIQKVLPCTVAVRVGSSSGSGVIVRPDGYVLTAGHVSGKPGQEVTVIFSDGRQVKGKTLGANHGADSGLIKLTGEGPWPFAEMGRSADLKRGEWCLALGHPRGYIRGRTPVVRLGRVEEVTERFIRTDCVLVGGDSGGPLFDMHGRVIGIHSRIGEPLEQNLHVPVDTYRDTWDRLARAEVWGSRLNPRLGITLDEQSKDCRIKEIIPGRAADRAGFKVGDIITQVDGQKIKNSEDLAARLGPNRSGDEVVVEVRRGEEVVSLKLPVGRRRRGPPRD